MYRYLLPIVALLLLFAGLWPDARSLYELTGEEDRPRQWRGIIHWAYTAARPQPNLAPTAPAAHADVSPFGVNVFLQEEVLLEVREQSLAMIREAGFDFIRQQFVWEDIEIHGKGDFIDRRNDPDGIDAWAKYDHIVALAEAYELEIIARLDNPPAWSRVLTDTIGTHAPPDNFDDYGDFVAAVVARYQGQITYFQLWNEPNVYPEWGDQPVDPEAFAELLCAGYRRAKAANPDAVILAPALAPTVAIDGRNMNNLIFLDRVYRAGGGDCFDIMAAQAYGLWSGGADRRLRPTVINYPHHLYVRDLMVAHGDAHKPVWFTEMGWNVAPEEMPAPYGRVTEEEQARYTVEAYRRLQREWPWVGVANLWFFKRASDFEQDQPWYYFRMMEPDFTPLPLFAAIADYMSGAAADSVEVKPAFYFLWQRARPWLNLIGGGLLFFSLLRFLRFP